MKIQGLIAAALSVVLAGCGQIQIISKLSGDGDSNGPVIKGPSTTRTYEVHDFSRLQAGAAFEIEYAVGHKTHVEIEAPEAAFEHIEVKNENGELHLQLNGNLQMEGTIKVKLTSPSLDGIDLSGASKGRFQGISSRSLKVDLSGAATAKVEGSPHEIRVDLSGSSDLDAATHGRFALRGTLSGNGNLKASGEVSMLDIEASGSSQVDLANMSAQQANIELDGASTITSKGTVHQLNVTASGASGADMGGLRVENAKVDANGGSHVAVGDIKVLTASASGGSSVTYKGNPIVSQSVSGGASVGPG